MTQIRVLAALAAAALLVPACGAAPPAGTDTTVSCGTAHGPFHTRQSSVLQTDSTRYVPAGINVTGLSRPLTPGTVADDEAVIWAARAAWCANTVRLQISQAQVTSRATHAAMLSAIEQEVSFARNTGLIVVLNDQTQNDAAGQTMPTHSSEAFWGSLAAHWGGWPSVVFDLFNEPALGAYYPPDSWAAWRDGIPAEHILGMQTLASFVRARAPRTLFWVEGPHTGGSLQEAWAYRLRHVYPLAYSVHRPPIPRTTASWTRTFGYLATRSLAPVVAGEWANYARPAAPWACWDDAPASVPRFLRYLTTTRIGLIVTRMVPGQLIQSTNLADPTHIRGNWACTPGLNQGAGHQIMQHFFRANS